MFRSKTLKAGVFSALALGLVLLVPGTSDAQRRGDGRGVYRGGNYSGYNGGNYGGWNRGWGGVGISIGTPGYYGGRPYYGGYYGGFPYYSGYRYPSYYYGNNSYYDTPTYTYSEPYSGTIPQTSFYSGNMISQNVAGFTVRVPDPNAEVWFQNYRTQQVGAVRQFQSESLDPNSNYTFQVRARWMQNGQMMDQTRQVSAHAGQSYLVDFTSGAVPAAPQNRLDPVSQ
jgi:uncharacterized protein (TIGR03000 family)